MISLVAAYDRNRLIGRAGHLPWHLPNDLKRVKEITTGHVLVMGRKTYESIGRPLPNRRNVVLTSDPSFHPEGVEVIRHPDDASALGDDLYIFGGAALFEHFLPLADRLYITKIDAEFEGDTYFPAWNENEFRLVEAEPGVVDEKNRHPHTFLIYDRNGL